MKKLKVPLTVAVVALSLMFSTFTTSVMAESNAIVRYFIVTAPTSPNNNSSIQNVMSYVDKGGVVGLIPNDINVDPRALNRPNILRPSQINFGPVGLNFWDSVSVTNFTTAFTNENGSRLAWSLDYTNSVPFLASDINFGVWSSDAANTIRFSGNIATNGTTPLTFSPTLRGEFWNTNGTKVSYYNGETIADHPVHRVMPLVRVGWYVTEMSQVRLNSDYFRNQMTMTNYVAFWSADGFGVTNEITSRPHLNITWGSTEGTAVVNLEGQRHMGMEYSLWRSPSMNPDEVVWSKVLSGMKDGGSYTNNLPQEYFRAMEEGIVYPASANAVSSVQGSTWVPVLRVDNGPE